MKHTLFEDKLIERIEERLPGAAPGVMVQVYSNGRKICDIGVGTSFAYYDLASLTKIIFTTQALMHAYQNEKWSLKTRIAELVDWYPDPHTLLVELLNHSSGLPWWLPMYKDMDLGLARADRWQLVREKIRSCEIKKEDVSVYSDVNFWVLAFILEKLFDKPLLDVWRDIKEQFYPRLSLDFSVDNQAQFPLKYYAPTEKCAWRGRVMQGEVHDENAWALGGVSTHAGLFGSIDDLGWFGLFVRGQLMGISRTLVKQKTARLFATRSRPPGKGDWALGYMMPTPGHSSCGDFFSPYSIGHTGFTGTSIWFDPAQDLLVAILSNRIAFGREIKDFISLRPMIHNWIIEGLRRA